MPTQIPAVEERVPQASIQKGTPVWADTETMKPKCSNTVFSIYMVSFSGYCYSEIEAWIRLNLEMHQNYSNLKYLFETPKNY